MGDAPPAQYPADIYPRPLRLLFTFVAPFALCMHLPVSYILDKPLWGASYLGVAACAPGRSGVFRGDGTGVVLGRAALPLHGKLRRQRDDFPRRTGLPARLPLLFWAKCDRM